MVRHLRHYLFGNDLVRDKNRISINGYIGVIAYEIESSVPSECMLGVLIRGQIFDIPNGPFLKLYRRERRINRENTGYTVACS